MKGNDPRLACPRDRSPLASLSPRRLACAHGHEYPVVGGVPVLLVEEAPQTSPIASRSLEAARRWADSDPPAGELFLESLGVSDGEREAARGLARSGSRIDPAVSVLVAATSGLAYRDLVGRLEDYPIPEIRLPPQAGARLLDVGCGWGRWSFAAARKGYRATGIDPSLGAVMAARRVAASLGIEADFACADARALPFADGSFDAAFSYSVIQHFSRADAAAAIAEAARVLRADGRVLVQMANAHGVRSLYHRARRGFAEGGGFDVRYWTIAELERAFAERFARVETSIHAFFGLGLEPSDAAIVSARGRRLIAASERLRRLSGRMPWLKRFADSVYVAASR